MFDNAATAITKQFILDHVTEEDIFKRYLGLEPTEAGSFTNPLRPNDHNPGCNFYVDSRGVWKFKDYAAGFNWDCFNVIEYDYGISFKEALIKVAIDFNLIHGNSPIKKLGIQNKVKQKPPELRVKRRPWTKEDYKFWAQYYITPERLEFFKVYPIQAAWFLREGVILQPIYGYTSSDPCFCYHFGSYDYKLYFPLRERGKFIHINSSIIQGYDQLPKEGGNLLITKSFKDVMAIDVLSREFDLYSVAPMSETIVIPKESYIDLYNRFDSIGTLFDFDRAGIKLMRKYEDAYRLPYYFFGKEFRLKVFGKAVIKDYADHQRVRGLDETRRLIERFLTKPQITGDVF